MPAPRAEGQRGQAAGSAVPLERPRIGSTSKPGRACASRVIEG